MKTFELIGPALDWAVAKILDLNYRTKEKDDLSKHIVVLTPIACPDKKSGCAVAHFKIDYFSPSTDWSQGGPIIERECIATYASGACSVTPKNPDYWVAEILDTEEMITQYGPTPLIAAMRCYCASKFGDEIEIPSELQP